MDKKEIIFNYIKELKLKPGSRLPTETQLCIKFGFTRYCIRKIINELCEEQKWIKIQGSGTYLPGGRENYRPIEKSILVLTPLLHDHIYDWLSPMSSIALKSGFQLLNLNIQHQQLIFENENLVPLVQRRIHSLVLEPYPGNLDLFEKIQRLQKSGTRCILLNAPENLKKTIPVYDFNYRKAGYMAAIYLMHKGCNKIIYITQYAAIAWQFSEFHLGLAEAAKDFHIPLECHKGYLIISGISARITWYPADFQIPLCEGAGYVCDDGYYSALTVYSYLMEKKIKDFSMITVGWNKYKLPFANLFFDNKRRMLDIVTLLTQGSIKTTNFRRTIDPELIESNFDGDELIFRL